MCRQSIAAATVPPLVLAPSATVPPLVLAPSLWLALGLALGALLVAWVIRDTSLVQSKRRPHKRILQLFIKG